MNSNNPNEEWYYWSQGKLAWQGPHLKCKLNELFECDIISSETRVASRAMIDRSPTGNCNGISYGNIEFEEINFTPDISELITTLNNRKTAIFSGPNNCGKTFLLKHLYYSLGQNGYFIASNRISEIDYINTRNRDPNETGQYYKNFTETFHTAQRNFDHNNLNLEQSITILKDSQRDKLFHIADHLLHCKLKIERSDPESICSPLFISLDGRNLRYSSTGTRLLLTILSIMLIDKFSLLFIDEPETGLNPRIQKSLANILHSEKYRESYFPHIKQIYIATHSHIFLDKSTLSNNYIVSKHKETIHVNAINSFSELHNLQFKMLGNELDSLFLPSVLVLVEGISDELFIRKVLSLHSPETKAIVISLDGEGNLKSILPGIENIIGELAKGPYLNRIIAILDKNNTLQKGFFKKKSLPEDHLMILKQNGIEYYYPEAIIQSIFGCDLTDFMAKFSEGDPVEINGIRKSKSDLSKIICDKLTLQDSLSDEIMNLVEKLKALAT